MYSPFHAPMPRMQIYSSASHYSNIVLDSIISTDQENSLKNFEAEVKKYSGARYVVPMPMARTAIYFALKAVIKPGQKVLLSPITIVCVINVVISAGGIPVFCDTEYDSANISPESIKQSLQDNVGAILVTHLHGLSCDMKAIMEIADNMGIPVIEDAAQAFSTKSLGNYVGGIGKIGVFSFGMYKIVNAFYGGALVTNDEKIYQDVIKQMDKLPPMPRSFYLKKVFSGLSTDIATSWPIFQIFTYSIFRLAYLRGIDSISKIVSVDANPVRFNKIPDSLLVKMLPIQAKLVAKFTGSVEKNNQARIRTAKKYHEALSDLKGLILPPLREDQSHTYTYYAIRVRDREKFVRFSMLEGRDLVKCHYHDTSALSIFSEFYKSCPIASATANEMVYLPTYPNYSDREINKTINMVRKFCST